MPTRYLALAGTAVNCSCDCHGIGQLIQPCIAELDFWLAEYCARCPSSVPRTVLVLFCGSIYALQLDHIMGQ